MSRTLAHSAMGLLFAAGLVASLVGVSCHSSSGGSGGPSAASAAGFAADFCNLLGPCCPDAGETTPNQVCLAFASAPFSESTYDAAAPPITYDPVLGQACLAAMQQESSGGTLCTTLASDILPCNQVFSATSGSVQPGQPCQQDSDCEGASDGGGAACLTQYALVDGGADLEGGSSETATCIQTMPGQVGDGPCIGTRSGATIVYDWGGDAGPPAQVYVCNAADGTTCDETSAKCVALAAVGQPCSQDSTCVTTAYCAAATVLDAGGSQCAPRLADGASCADAFSGCLPTSYCDQGSMKCTPLLAVGSPCTVSDQCASNACANQVCAASLGLAVVCASQ